MRILITSFIIMCGLAVHAAGPEQIRVAIAREFIDVEPAKDVSQFVESINENGFWADIDYNDDSRSFWQLERHLDRLVDIARAYRQGGATDTVMLAAAIRGLDNWFANNYTNPNWWYGKIGVPRRLLPIAYLLDEKLPAKLHDDLARSLSIVDSNDFPARPGGDRIQVLSNHAKVLLWRGDYQGVDSIYSKIEAEARIAPYEDYMYDAAGGPAVRNNWRPSGRGAQADMSFHHRGDRVNSTLTYGLELPEFFSYWAKLLQGSEHPFSTEAVNFVIDFYLDGVSRHLVAGRYAEPTIINRENARPGERHVSNSHLARRLLEINNSYRTAELVEAAERLEGKDIPSHSFAAHFYESDYFVFSRPTFQTAVRFHSQRVANQEAPHNSEGIRNHFRGDGANMLSVTGLEYADIAPVFDFRLVPGATTRLIPYGTPASWGELVVLNSPVAFAGAVNDSLYGAVAFDFVDGRTGSLSARKAWFFFDNEYLCLGAGINASATDSVVTTVEQRLSGDAKVAQTGDWYFCGGNAYHILDGDAVASNGPRAGAWSNCVDHTSYANDSVTADVYTLYIKHGVAPADATYAYAIVPGADAPLRHDFTIFANSKEMQAAGDIEADLLYIVFYEPGKLDTPLGAFAADRPCMLMYRQGSVYLADPARKYKEINVEVPGAAIRASMPEGRSAGTSLKIR